jgi:hypothetical protein
MSGEIQSSMQSLRVPVVKLQRVEEIYPALLREGVVSALCRESHFIVLFPGFMWPKKSDIFRKLMLDSSFSTVLAVEDIFSCRNVLMYSFFFKL